MADSVVPFTECSTERLSDANTLERSEGFPSVADSVVPFTECITEGVSGANTLERWGGFSVSGRCGSVLHGVHYK